jgi:hypothetical protein
VWVEGFTSTDAGRHFVPIPGIQPGTSNLLTVAEPIYGGIAPTVLRLSSAPPPTCSISLSVNPLDGSSGRSGSSIVLNHQGGIGYGPASAGTDGTIAINIASSPKNNCGPAYPDRIAVDAAGQGFGPLIALPADLYVAAVYDRDTMWFLTAKTHQALISTDGGHHRIPLPHSNIDAVLPLTATTVLLTHNTGKQEQVFRSTDGGKTISLVLTIGNGGFPAQIRVIDATTIAVIGPAGLLVRSTDGGKTWREAGHIR